MDFIDNRKDKINFDVMGLGKANAIFKNLDSDKYTNLEKVDAIKTVVDMETHNSITKDEILKAFKWLLSIDYIINDIEGVIMGKSDGEILTGILDDLSNDVSYEEIVKAVMGYILKVNSLNEVHFKGITVKIENDKDIIIEKEG